jgi:uncharacterized membrane protein
MVLGITLILVDVLLLVWLWRERKTRGGLLSPEDARHFARQDIRRVIVSGVVLLLALGMWWGSRIPPLVGGRPNALFIQVWLGVIVLIVILVLLAFADWVATRFYARRRRLELLEEGIGLIQEQRKAKLSESLHAPGQNGHAGSNGMAS